jgi:uncharacterized protein YjbI with pentapeptide repeats
MSSEQLELGFKAIERGGIIQNDSVKPVNVTLTGKWSNWINHPNPSLAKGSSKWAANSWRLGTIPQPGMHSGWVLCRAGWNKDEELYRSDWGCYVFAPRVKLRAIDRDELRQLAREGAFLRSRLPHAMWFDQDFSNAKFAGVYMGNASLRLADLSEADLQDTVLRDADLWHAVMIDTCAKGANLERANLKGVTAYRADFSRSKMTGANCFRMDASGSVFVGVDAYRIDFSEAVLKDVVFENCDLRMADFTGAQIDGSTRFVNCRLEGASFYEVTPERLGYVDRSRSDWSRVITDWPSRRLA